MARPGKRRIPRDRGPVRELEEQRKSAPPKASGRGVDPLERLRGMLQAAGNTTGTAALPNQPAPGAVRPGSLAGLPQDQTWNVVVVGSPGPVEVKKKHCFQFVNAAAHLGGTSPQSVWLVERTGYEMAGLSLSEVERRAGRARVFWIAPDRPLEKALREFPHHSIESLQVFSHGLAGHLALRYGWPNFKDYGLDPSGARSLSPDSFVPGAVITFDSCNTGTGGEDSLAQLIADAAEQPVTAWTGRTSYREFSRRDQFPDPQIRGSEIFPSTGGKDAAELWSRIQGHDPIRETFAPNRATRSFTSRYLISGGVRSRVFSVTRPGSTVSVRVSADSEYTGLVGQPVHLTLYRPTGWWRPDVQVDGDRIVRVGASAEFDWASLSSGDYYLEIWIAMRGYVVEGTLSVTYE